MTFIKNISSSEADRELVSRYKISGDMVILGDLYQRYMELVYGVCLKYMKDPEEAKDCVLAIFEELVTKLKKHEVQHFKPWLYQLAKNHCLMKLRKHRIVPVNADVADMHLTENEHPSFELEKEEHFKQMEYCLGQIATVQRQVIELFYLQDRCYREITESTGIELNMVKSYIQNGRRNLKIVWRKGPGKNHYKWNNTIIGNIRHGILNATIQDKCLQWKCTPLKRQRLKIRSLQMRWKVTSLPKRR